jgi:hypothetical protein
MPPFQPRNWRADVIDRMVAGGRISCRPTVGEVADDLGIDRGALVGTVARYNGFAAAGEDARLTTGCVPTYGCRSAGG